MVLKNKHGTLAILLLRCSLSKPLLRKEIHIAHWGHGLGRDEKNIFK